MSEAPMYQRQRPYVHTVEAGTPYRICRCGHSAEAPACDGHSEDCAPYEHLSKRKEQLFICGCNKSGQLPFCDGSHNKNNNKSAGQLFREFIRNPFAD